MDRQEKDSRQHHSDSTDFVLGGIAYGLLGGLVLLPGLAHAAPAGGDAFGGITEFLKTIARLLIVEWGYYIGIITLAIQGYRWKTGRIDLMQLGGWGLGIGLVLFAPSIVMELKNRAGTQI